MANTPNALRTRALVLVAAVLGCIGGGCSAISIQSNGDGSWTASSIACFTDSRLSRLDYHRTETAASIILGDLARDQESAGQLLEAVSEAAASGVRAGLLPIP